MQVERKGKATGEGVGRRGEREQVGDRILEVDLFGWSGVFNNVAM